MSNSDSPAGPADGPVTLRGLDDLPEKLRVHALAKLLGRTSREVLVTLAELGVPARSVQSSVDRKVAEQVAAALLAEPEAPVESASAGQAAEVVVAEPALVPAFGVAPTGTAPVDDTGEPTEAASAPGLAPLFAPPAPVFTPQRTSRRTGVDDDTERAVVEPDAVETSADRTDEVEARLDDDTGEPAEGTADDETGEGGTRRRRRRGRRGRGRGRGGEGDGAEASDDVEPDVADTDDAEVDTAEAGEDTAEAVDSDTGADEGEGEGEDDEAGGTRRRRRRRRRRGSGDEAATEDETDPPNTVVRVRPPRERSDDDNGDGVQSVRGSTRLEAKRQRRRDGRDAGRRRVPILTEAEFLARREAVDRSMVVRERGDRVEIGVLEDGVLVEHFVTGLSGQNGSLVGNIYLGRVQNVLPSMEAAFVDIGRGRNAVLYAGEVDWDAAGLGGRARRIEQALASGDSVLVQVTKDPVGHKGARLTTQISLAGRFLVYVPSGGAAGISRKLPDVERKRLKDLLREIVPTEAGVIIRTASEGVTQEALERDVRRLQAQWEVIKDKAEKTGPDKPKAPVLLYQEPDMLIKVIRDQFNEDFSRLVVSGDDAWETVSQYVGHVAPELVPRLHRHVGPRDVFEEFRIDEQLLKALDRKVWLPSGGTLVIDRTEAMTVIDVNTGKFTGSGGNLEETVTRNNLEAAEEIVRQLRLRDIGGIIVIDFIDMVLEANRDLVLRRLTECLARDRTRHQVAEVTSLGLVQMTRKRVGGGLLEHFSTPCEHCRGRGVVISTEPVAEPSGRDRAGDRNGDGSGRRSRGRSRRDEPIVDRGPRRLPDAIVPDRVEATLDVGAPAPAVEPAVGIEPATVESARDEIEEVVVEQALAAERGRHSGDEPTGKIPASPDGAVETPQVAAVNRVVAAEAAVGDGAEASPSSAASNCVGSEHTEAERPARRRGRVTRSAGAPTAGTGDAPVAAVVTVPARPADAAEPEVGVAAAPAVAATSAVEPRARRVRRAATRPAGPPVVESGGSGSGDAANRGDPV